MTEARLTVVLPCRDQEDHLERVLRSYAPALDAADLSFEVVVVPNACRDRTPEVARQVAREDPRFRVEETDRPGWGHAVLTGLSVARGSLLAYANSARTDPSWLPDLVALHDRSAPCVAKVRRRQRGAPLREAGSFLFNLEAKLLFGIRAGDVNGTPKLFSRAVFERLRPSRRDDLLDLEILAEAARLGIPTVEIEVAGFKRHGGRSSTNFASAWRMYLGAVRLRRYRLAPPRS